MTHSSKRIAYSALIHLLAIASVYAVVAGAVSLANFGLMGTKGANIYYDGVHGARHLWNRDNKRHRIAYHTVSGFNRFYDSLQEEGYDVHVETHKRFNKAILSKYDVFFVGEQTYHAKFMSERERDDLLQWIKEGGSMFAIIEHTDAHYMAETFDFLFKDLPIKVRRDGICDLEQTQPLSPSWVSLTSDESHPTTKGVKEFRFYNGASLDTEHGVVFSMASSWSDEYNPTDRPIQNGNKRRDPHERSGPLAGAAAFEYGEGRVVVVSDHNAMSNPTMYWGDHYRFVMNSVAWLAGERLNKDFFLLVSGILVLAGGLIMRRKVLPLFRPTRWSVLAVGLVLVAIGVAHAASGTPHYDFFVHTGNDTDMKYMTKKRGGFLTLYGQWTKEPQLNPWAHRDLKSGYDSLFLSSPTRKYSEDQLEIIDGYLSRGKTVVYMATKNSLESPAGKQLKEKFEFEVKYNPVDIGGTRPFNAYGPRKWTEGIFRWYITRGSEGVIVDKGLDPIVYLTYGNYHITSRDWRNSKHHFDVLSTKSVGLGEFWLLAPVNLFDDRALKNLHSDSDVVRQQMAEFIIRLGKFSVGDHSQFYED